MPAGLGLLAHPVLMGTAGSRPATRRSNTSTSAQPSAENPRQVLVASATRLIWEQPADHRALAAPPPPPSGHMSSPSEDASDSSCRAKRFGHHRQLQRSQCCPTKPSSCMTFPNSPPGGRALCDWATRQPRSGAT